MGGRWVEHVAKPHPDDPTTMVATGEVIIHDDRDLADAQRDALQNLKHHYEHLVAAGRNYGGKNFQIDGDSLRNLSAVIAVEAPGRFLWIASDNSRVSLSDSGEVMDFARSLVGYASDLVSANRAKKDAIAALTSVKDCDDFDVTTGWPENQ